MSDQNWNPFDANLLKETADQANAASTLTNFGKLSVESRYLHFTDQGVIDATPAEYAKALKTKERGYMQEVMFTVDPSELNPAAMFMYQRKVRIVGHEKVKETGKYVKSDWNKTVEPSITAVFGSLDEFAKRLNSKTPVYVEVADVPQQTSPDFNTIKFVHVYADLNDCKAAWQTKYPGTNKNGNESKFSVETLQAVKLLKQAIKDEGQLRIVIANDNELKKYPIDELLAAAA